MTGPSIGGFCSLANVQGEMIGESCDLSLALSIAPLSLTTITDDADDPDDRQNKREHRCSRPSLVSFLFDHHSQISMRPPGDIITRTRRRRRRTRKRNGAQDKDGERAGGREGEKSLTINGSNSRVVLDWILRPPSTHFDNTLEIGRASCRERVCSTV